MSDKHATDKTGTGKTPPDKPSSSKSVGTKASSDKSSGVRWLSAPEDHDFPAAAAYLALIATPAVVDTLVTALRAGDVTHQKAKDILRASRLPLLDTTNVHVRSDLAKVSAGKPLSPVLLVRGDARAGLPTQIADGYHRVCASYHTDENTDIPVVIADLPHAGR